MTKKNAEKYGPGVLIERDPQQSATTEWPRAFFYHQVNAKNKEKPIVTISPNEPTLISTILNDLQEGGTLSQRLPRYEERPAQIEMASLVTYALENQVHAALEASTGTGKSLAYLLPLVHSGKVALVSTANKALQEQLFYKDIPFLQKHIKSFSASLVKGMSNYLCKKRFEEERADMREHTSASDFRRLDTSINDPRWNGDFEMLPFPIQSDLKGKVCGDADQCTQSRCPYFSNCFIYRMKDHAQNAQIIVVNHRLLLLNSAMERKILPEHDIIIVDEAHHIEEEATNAFTLTIKDTQIYSLLSLKLLRAHTSAKLLNDVSEMTMHLWLHLEQQFGEGVTNKMVLNTPLEEGLQLASRMKEVITSLQERRFLVQTEEEEILLKKLIQRSTTLMEHIRMAFAVDQKEHYVYYLERTMIHQEHPSLEVAAAPLDVSSWLKEKLFAPCPVICTSATLATVEADGTPTFSYFRRRVGLDDETMLVLERILPLSFDYPQQALLYVPRDIREPAFGNTKAAEDYMLQIARRMYALVNISRGRAFLLFSSRRMLDRVYELMSPHLPYPLLKQGEMTRIELTRRFREEEGAVLFGLKSFWEGVDIAGEALSLVVIDKVPFDPPDDPVHEARLAQMKARGENWFETYVLPQTVLRLKQGVGRLIRTKADRGVMVILDTRLYSKRYGRQVLDALPPARRTAQFTDVKNFFESG